MCWPLLASCDWLSGRSLAPPHRHTAWPAPLHYTPPHVSSIGDHQHGDIVAIKLLDWLLMFDNSRAGLLETWEKGKELFQQTQWEIKHFCFWINRELEHVCWDYEADIKPVMQVCGSEASHVIREVDKNQQEVIINQFTIPHRIFFSRPRYVRCNFKLSVISKKIFHIMIYNQW